MVLPESRSDREYFKFIETENGETAIRVSDIVNNSLVDGEYDYIELSYTGDDLTGVTYKLGGASGTVVTTLTLSYSGGKLVSVAKS